VTDLPAILDTWSALSWIAFREVRPRSDSSLQLAVEARASENPYCVVGLSRDGPRLARQARAQARQREKRLVSYQDLTAMLRRELAPNSDANSPIRQAQGELLEALRAGKLAAWGKRGEPWNTAKVEPIGHDVFRQRYIAVTPWGKIGADPEDAVARFQYRGKTYWDVTFATAEVVAVWPVPATVAADISRELPPTRSLPPFDYRKAKVRLAALKVSGEFRERPTLEDAREVLRRDFADVPRDPVSQILVELYGPGTRGRPRSAN
jgi:hypothetical protein